MASHSDDKTSTVNSEEPEFYSIEINEDRKPVIKHDVNDDPISVEDTATHDREFEINIWECYMDKTEFYDKIPRKKPICKAIVYSVWFYESHIVFEIGYYQHPRPNGETFYTYDLHRSKSDINTLEESSIPDLKAEMIEKLNLYARQEINLRCIDNPEFGVTNSGGVCGLLVPLPARPHIATSKPSNSYAGSGGDPSVTNPSVEPTKTSAGSGGDSFQSHPKAVVAADTKSSDAIVLINTGRSLDQTAVMTGVANPYLNAIKSLIDAFDLMSASEQTKLAKEIKALKDMVYKNPPPRGMFILFEGLDRSGKTTQCGHLVTALNKQKKDSAVLMRFPDRSTAIGKTIDEYLKGTKKLSPQAAHLLFSANRWEKKDEIEDLLKAGVMIVMDRYSYSGIAYSTAKGLKRIWCEQSEVGLPEPDVVIFMDIKPEDAAKRGDYGKEQFEKVDFQKKVNGVFELFRHNHTAWHSVPASLSVEMIQKAVLDIVDKRRCLLPPLKYMS